MFAVKRKEPVVKAMRRTACERLDRALASLHTADAGLAGVADRVRNDLDRLLALWALVSPGMDKAAAQREAKVLRRSWRKMQRKPDVEARLRACLESAGGNLAGITPETIFEPASQDQENESKPRRRKRGPDPAVHRMIADLAEVRMRAGYWHVAGEGFAALMPGFRSTYTRARRLATEEPLGDPADLAVALRRLADQQRWLERCWPEVLGAQRQRLIDLAEVANGCAEDLALSETLPEGGASQRVAAFIDAQTQQAESTIRQQARALFSETPGRFIDRHAAYWSAWRSDT